MLEWMAWTPPTALFFGAIFLLLAGMTVWEARQPSPFRRGLLPIPTTRGDRLFIGLLSTAFVMLGWIALTDLSLWWPLLIGALLMLLIGRFG